MLDFKCPKCGKMLKPEDPIEATICSSFRAIFGMSRSLRFYCKNKKCGYSRKGYRYKLSAEGRIVKDSGYNAFFSSLRF